MRVFLTLPLLLCLLAAPDQARSRQATPSLAIGDPAPPLRVEAFLKGEPIAAFEPGKVYVVEFWATWCGPCIEQMPHLSALQALYADRGVTIVGTDIREMRRVGPGFEEVFDDETRSRVEAFVEAQGDRMAYTVAYDGGTRAMDQAWMQAAKGEGLPLAFLVDRTGTLAWFGHPMVLRMPLDEVVAGTWDLENGPRRVREAEEAFFAAMRLFPSDVDAGLAAWDRAVAEHPLLATDLLAPKFQALMAANRCEAAWETGRAWIEEAVRGRDTRALNSIAWSVVDPRANRSPLDLDLALRAASKACELTGNSDPSLLDTLARVHFRRGELDTAIEIQERALAAADEAQQASLAPALKEYREARQAKR